MKRLLLTMALSVFLAACDSSEEKADAHYLSAVERVADGDTEGAILDLRNALKLNAGHKDARRLFADLLFDDGEVSAAFRQYKEIYESDPTNLDAIRAMAGIAFDGNDTEAAEDYLERGMALASDDIGFKEINVGLDYRAASRAQDDEAISAAVEAANALLGLDQSLIRARRVAVAGAIRAGDPEAALALIEAGLERAPEDRGLLNTKLVALNQLGRTDDIETHILNMVAVYPEDARTQRLLVDWYLAKGQVDEAASWLEGRIDPTSDDPLPRMVYLRFLSEVRSNDVMRSTLRALLAEDPVPADIAANEEAFRALLAGGDHLAGDTAAAIASLEALLEGKEPDIRIDRIKMQLAVMRRESGDAAGAMELVEEVLAHDPGQLQAIKLKAEHLIATDRADEALLSLRGALNDAPEDPDLFSLMATVYAREGRPALVADMLARAVDSSLSAPAESLRYAAYLMENDQPRATEKVLGQALRRAPKSLDLLRALAAVHIELRDWPRLRADLERLRETHPQERALATEIETRLIAGQAASGALGTQLDTLSDDASGDLSASLAIVRGLVQAGELDRARDTVAELAQKFPDAPEPRLAAALLMAEAGQASEALAVLENLVADHPETEAAWTTIVSLKQQNSGPSELRDVLDTALTHHPESRVLNITLARLLEAEGDHAGAIAIYERLYAADGSDLVVANNLASLLSNGAAPDVDRALRVSKRLRQSDVPAFLDTYGWAAHLSGDADEALEALSEAAKGLPDEPVVRFHFGVALAAAGQVDAARAELEAATNLLRNSPDADPSLAQDVADAMAALAQ